LTCCYRPTATTPPPRPSGHIEAATRKLGQASALVARSLHRALHRYLSALRAALVGELRAYQAAAAACAEAICSRRRAKARFAKRREAMTRPSQV
jgi:hypothetical protein